MHKTTASRILPLLLAVVMIFSILPISAMAEDDANAVTTYNEFVTDFESLESYAGTYAAEHSGEDVNGLIINFIRTGVERYTSSAWQTFCGPENTAFASFVADQDAANGTHASALKNVEQFTLPNGDEADFGHMFGCLDMWYHTKNNDTADLGSWTGDLCDLVWLAHHEGVSGTVDEMSDEIRTNNDKYFLRALPSDGTQHSFSRTDLYGDLDSSYLRYSMGSGTKLSTLIKNYFTSNLNDKYRVKFFLDNRLPGKVSKEDLRDAVYSAYTSNEGIMTLEGTYITGGVNTDIRKACCYAFADYLYLTINDSTAKSYYSVFSSQSSTLAPGITQTEKRAMTTDNKQIVYYIATADVSRSDVDVYANYKDCDPSTWGMQRVSDQMKAAEAKHSDIPNFKAVVGVNADYYNMSNGAPSGALVMNGKIYNGIGNENFFAILNDGTPIIGTSTADWNKYKDSIRDAVGGGAQLVKDGKIAVAETSDYYNNRVSRTCVGITYDGKVVFMVLDGRQEPFSAGGSAEEIAQIMLDAGCVTAINLDGGGSTTFASKAEGSDTISVVNRPSDGYERSVSSSLVMVSTAKPSNTFDHAVVSADYDYVTVGTSLDISVSGVTATGGAIALPDGTALSVSDSSIGSIDENGTFTAAALGDVKIQASADGKVLGEKTIHVVQPTDLKFTKNSINAIYGIASSLPIEASYNGNLVKINPNDVTFGYVKKTLTSMGSIEGGDVNTTKTELVFTYPEAGSIENFEFTPASGSTLRTLTIGAVLTSKMSEFQNQIEAKYMSAYQEAINNGLSSDNAAIAAQSASINAALELAAKLTVYMYNADEASFDFDNVDGRDDTGILSWNRTVADSKYDPDEVIYLLSSPDASGTASYTFAVDMTKVPIPEKLQGLLYMLPGGDQEGRSAWDFMLQLAERISPLTNVTVKMNIPEGFAVDTNELKLVNDFFSLKSAELNGNELTVTLSFNMQTEPVNPTDANPICILSGLKLTPKADAAWNEKNELASELTGSISYDIYAHFHVLKSLASQTEYQEKYGLYPYDNSENLNDDYGAHFPNEVINFSDTYTLRKSAQNGWARENGAWSYYDNGTALTGIRELPSFESGEKGTFWYDLGENGTCTGKYTGLIEQDGATYYARFGLLVTGWQSVQAADGESYFYYFDEQTHKAATGVTTISGLTYTFNDAGQMIRGAFHNNGTGLKYYVAGESQFRKFITLEEGTYWLDIHGYVAYGNDHTVTDNVKDVTWYHFDENTGLLTGICSGIFKYKDGKLYYADENGKVFNGVIQLENGVVFSKLSGELSENAAVYIDSSTAQRGCSLENGWYYAGSDGYIQKDGFYTANGSTYYVSNHKHAKGLTKIGDDYYIFNAGNGKMYKDANMWVNANSYGVEPGMHHFDANGKMFVPDTKNGEKKIITENGKLYFTIDGVKMVNGLYELNGDYYFAQYSGELAVNKSVYVETKLLSGNGQYGFGADGKLIKTGFITGADGKTYYYSDGVRSKGFTKIGDDYYLFNAGSGMMYKEANMWVGANSYGVESGMHYFGTDGKMFVPDTKNGEKKIISENGKLYFTIDGVKAPNGLYELDGDYYYVKTNSELAVGETVWVAQTNDLIPKGKYTDWHYFGSDGKLQKTGFVTGGDGYTYYYDNNVMVLGFTKIGDDYYIFNQSSGKMYKDANMWVGANSYGVESGVHHFDADGKMN